MEQQLIVYCVYIVIISLVMLVKGLVIRRVGFIHVINKLLTLMMAYTDINQSLTTLPSIKPPLITSLLNKINTFNIFLENENEQKNDINSLKQQGHLCSCFSVDVCFVRLGCPCNLSPGMGGFDLIPCLNIQFEIISS